MVHFLRKIEHMFIFELLVHLTLHLNKFVFYRSKLCNNKIIIIIIQVYESTVYTVDIYSCKSMDSEKLSVIQRKHLFETYFKS